MQMCGLGERVCVWGGGRGRGRDVSLEYLTMGFIFTALPHSKNEIFLLHCGQGGGGVRQLQGWMANHLLIRPWVFHLDSASSLNLIQSLLSSVFVGFRNAICPSNPRVNHRLLPPPPSPRPSSDDSIVLCHQPSPGILPGILPRILPRILSGILP